ncbi:Multifunctional non-homologous end joining DNA repair protein LigD [Paenibacillus auburnensis]|uniref:Multifunctional non-homologous end joining DNA repair protein LigD n=1 Tax=Paenibacillus auburnensis TaxID=2905649 RepID=A0ABM9BTQ4_9BACL|nr:ATP-dependent DNA ligase [Paenibacillus auburnensis]CAH1194675.1 Multifunctional non-homologous end joining DNA repair protein LigD [Paenibacillus auburnensis]
MYISPMLLETAAAPFSDSRYIYEPKIDGHRLLYDQPDASSVHLYTRHNNECTRQYPEISVPFPHDITLDGEIACVDPQTGAVDFESVMSRFQARRSDTIRRLIAELPVTYVIFDILRYKGEDLRNRPLMERKAILAGLALPNAHFGVTPYVEGAGEALFAQMQARAMEGVVAKRKDSVYETGRRSAQWQKIINWTYADVYLSGYKKAEFGWLTSVPDNRGKMRPAGVIEFGASPTHKKAFYGVSKALITGEDSDFVYVEPRIRARVKIRNWTRAGMLRSPVFTEFIV